MKITFKSSVNANGKTGIIINAYRIKKAWDLVKHGGYIRSALFFFHAGYEFEGDTKSKSNVLVKALIITAAITLTSLFASAQTGNTIVQSGKTVVKLDNNRIAYVLSHTKNVSVRQALTNGTQTIRNNGQADIICAILKGKRN